MRPLFRHLLHVVAPLVLWGANPRGALAVLASGLLFFALFALFHDALHGALGLSRRGHEHLLSCAGVLLGISGHAARRAHLVHHARPFAKDDPEGGAAGAGAWAALRSGPACYLGLRAWGHVHAPQERAVQSREWCAVALFLGGLLLCPAGRLYLGTLLALHATMPFWAAFLPHHPPRVLLAGARVLARAGFQLPGIFVTHELHHQHPRLDGFTLLRRWRDLQSTGRCEPRAPAPPLAAPSPRSNRAGRAVRLGQPQHEAGAAPGGVLRVQRASDA